MHANATPTMDHITSTFNFWEGVFWLAMAAAALGMLVLRRRNRDLAAAGAVVLAAFGVSDFVERQTGAWYNPWWLLVWKGCCLAGLAAIMGLYERRRRRPW